MKYLFLLSLLILLSGCGLNHQELQLRQQGIVNACYTVIEHNPQDKTKRIETYLDFNVKQKHITNAEKNIIKKCLERTETSVRWSK